MPEIRRIQDGEGGEVAALWDRMCQEVPDGGPLSPRGRRNIGRMADMGGWHRDAFFLVAVEEGRIIGFADGLLDQGAGLLPGLLGLLEDVYVVPEHRGRGLSRALAEAGVAWLRERGAGTVRTLVCAGDPVAITFWQDRGFEADMICLSLYTE